MIRTEMRSFSCTQVLFIGVSQAHRAVDQRLRTCERRNSALAPLRQLPGPVETTPQPPRPANEVDGRPVLLLDLAAVAAPQRVERAFAIDALVCVSAEVITLTLNEVGGKLGRADAVVIGE